MNIGENLKRLRKEKEITQEELSDYLGVSFQSVSRWERDECYPDITLLPGIANFFEVSVDELLGMDKLRDKNRLYEIMKTIHELEADYKYEEAIAILRQALKDFPNNYGFMSELALAIGDIEPHEAIRLTECVLANSVSEKCKHTARANLCLLYNEIGEQEKALALAKTLPHDRECREFITDKLVNEDSHKLTRRLLCLGYI